MVQKTIAQSLSPTGHFSLASVLFSCVLALSSLLLDAPSVAAHEDEKPFALTRPDFRFTRPRFIVGLRGGLAINRANGGIYDFIMKDLTLNDADFYAPAFTLDFAVRTWAWLDVVVGFEVTGGRSNSEYRHFIEEGGSAIKQKTTLTQIPLTLSLKFFPMGRGRQVGTYAWIRSTIVPYIGGGVGATWDQFKQRGDFIDLTDSLIFEATLISNG